MKIKRLLTVVITVVMLLSVFSLSADAATFTADVDTSSWALYLLNMDTDTVVYEKNSTEKMFPASTTKIMTYIVARESVSDPKTTRVLVEQEVLDKLEGTESSLSGLYQYVGEYVTVDDLLKCLMIKSGNDAAMVLANYIGEGSIQAFVDMMNDKTAELGCKNTHFKNPHGLQDEDHYTTAEDLATITKYAQTLPDFNEISNTVTTYLSVDENKEYPIITTNYLIDETRGGDYYFQYAKGIKTGTHDEAGYCLVSTASKDGYTYMCIALKSPSVDKDGEEIETNGAMLDSKALYEWAFSNLAIKSVIDEQTPVCEVPVDLALNQDSVLLVPQDGYSTILPNDIDSTSIDIITDIPEKLTAPVIEGTVIGTATISYANQELTTVNLVAGETVERSKALYFLETAKKILMSKWMIFAIAIVVVLFIIYAIITIIYNRKKKKKKNNKNRISSKK